MYRITVKNGGQNIVIHDSDPDSLQKLASGSIDDEINAVPQMTFSIFPQNAGFTSLRSMTTEIEVYNTVMQRPEFEGYLWKPTGTMKKSGAISYKWTAEGYMGFLMDSVQDYHTYKDTDVPDFLTAVLAAHNAMTESRKHIFLGECDIHDTGSKTTAYRRTLEEIRELLVNRLGGEIRIRKTGGKLYLDYLRHYGKNSATKIELAKNLQEIEVTQDPANIITRLIPLGKKLNDETAERLTIASVNNGCIWIDDQEAYAEYGTYQCATYEWDDVTVASHLMQKAQEFLQQNNTRKRYFKLTALDLALIGLDAESFTVGDSYKTENTLMRVNEWLRCTKRHINICEPTRSTLEIGEKTESLTVKANRTYHYVTYEIPKVENDVLNRAHDRASAMLGLAGNSYLEFNEDAGELLIMNSRDKYGETTRVWRYNANGWGVSNTGYNGTYTMAATFDNGFVADFITAGVLTGIEIRNGDDTFHVGTDGTVTASAINITGGSIQISTDSEGNDIIQLNCDKWKNTFSPLEWVVENTGTKRKICGRASGIYFYNENIRPDGFPVAMIEADDGSAHLSSITASSVTAEIGHFDTLQFTLDGDYYDLAQYFRSINSKIDALWNAVFTNS